MSHELNLASMLALIAGGLALFLFGLELMTDSLKAVAGSGLQAALGKLTAGRFRGLLALAVPSLGLQRVHLELKRLGDLAIEMVQRVRIVAVEGSQHDLDALVSRDNQIDRLESAILIYLGKLSQSEHTEDQAREMVSLVQIANTLEALSDVVTTSLASLSRRRLAEGIDLARLRDNSVAAFADAVIRNLEQAVATIGQPSPAQAAEVLAAKGRIQDLAESARKSLLSKLQLSEKKDAVSFSLAADMIEQFKQIAHLARQIAAAAQERVRGKATFSDSANEQANRTDSEQDSKALVKTSRESD